MTISKLQSTFLFPSSEIRVAPEDFYTLLEYATGKPKEFLFAHPEYELDTETEVRAREYFRRRFAHEPVAYIIGEREFRGLPFRVTPDTLIPRPETELLVEHVIEQATANTQQRNEATKKILIADIGTGSGAIIVSIASALKKHFSELFSISRCTFHACDTSRAALEIAQENARRNDVDTIISFHHGDLLRPIEQFLYEADKILLAANLPYLSHSLYESTPEDVREYEPREALISGEDGLDHYRRLFAQLKKFTQENKFVSAFCEISPEQDKTIEKLANNTFPDAETATIPDLSGQPRVFIFSRGKP